MGLFDRIRGRDENEEIELQVKRRSWRKQRAQEREAEEPSEVELRAPGSRKNRSSRKNSRSRSQAGTGDRRTTTTGSDDGDEGTDDDGGGGFILPGMKSSSSSNTDTAGEDRGNREPGTGTRRDGPADDRLEQVLEQNERIIELLEEIAGVTASESDRDNPLKDSDMW